MSRASQSVLPRWPQCVRETITVGSRSFLLDRPALMVDEPDRPDRRFQVCDDDYPPHWLSLWPAAKMLAKALLAESWPANLLCLELGCGLGLGGIAALASGMSVTFSDFDVTATELACHNAKLNGFTSCRGLKIDWCDPPIGDKYPMIIGSDITYYHQCHDALVQLLNRVLTPNGVVWITDSDRKQSPPFFDRLRSNGWHYDRRVMHGGTADEGRVRGTLYRITRARQ